MEGWLVRQGMALQVDATNNCSVTQKMQVQEYVPLFSREFGYQPIKVEDTFWWLFHVEVPSERVAAFERRYNIPKNVFSFCTPTSIFLIDSTPDLEPASF